MACDLTDILKERVWDHGEGHGIHKCFPEPVARDVFAQISSATAYLHSSMQMVHRDLKPDNILVTPASLPETQGPWPSHARLVVKLSDFGLSANFSSTKVMKAFCGTPSYSAPEIIDEKRHGEGYSRAVDAWSCGVILYNMLHSRLPFPAGKMETLVAQINATKEKPILFKPRVVVKVTDEKGLSKDVVKLGNVSEAAQDLMRRLLDPSQVGRRHVPAGLARHLWEA